jgi:hypothetical protein
VLENEQRRPITLRELIAESPEHRGRYDEAVRTGELSSEACNRRVLDTRDRAEQRTVSPGDDDNPTGRVREQTSQSYVARVGGRSNHVLRAVE